MATHSRYEYRIVPYRTACCSLASKVLYELRGTVPWSDSETLVVWGGGGDDD